MSGWLAVLGLAGVVLAAVAAGMAVADLTGRHWRRPVLVALGVALAAVIGLALADPGLAFDVRSAIVALVFEDTGLASAFDGMTNFSWNVWGWIVGLVDWWRTLSDAEAWHSMGFVLVPLAIVILPVLLWQITKSHVND